MLEQSIVAPEELKDNNLQEFLEDETFVDYFNTFLALPCFATRLHYNKEIAQFEEFIEKLAGDEVKLENGAPAYQLRELSHFQGISYYVMVLDKLQGMEFVQSFRLPIFLKSELYAEYKLTMILSSIQGSLLGDFGIEDDFLVDPAGSSLQGNRVRSGVSFNINTSEQDDFDSSVFGDRSITDSPHVRTIDDTFTAWQESFKRADSRASLFSYTSGNSSLRPPAVSIPDYESETSSVSSARELNARHTSKGNSVGGVSSNNSSPHGSKVSWETSVLGNESKSIIGESQSNGEESECNDEIKEMIKNDSAQNESQEKEELVSEISNDESVKTDFEIINENSRNEIADDDVKEDDNNPPCEEKSTESPQTCVSDVLAAQALHSQDAKKEEDQRKMNAVDEEVQEESPEQVLDDTKETSQESLDKPEYTNQTIPVNQDRNEEINKDQPLNTQTDQISTSFSEISNEVSIPIIVSDDASKMTSGRDSATDNLLIRYEHSQEKIFQAADTELEGSHSERESAEIIDESVPIAGGVVDGEASEDKNEKPEEIIQEEQKGERIVKCEDVKEKKQSHRHLSVGEDDEAVDPNFDLDTASEYTLRGIRGILRRRPSIAATSIVFDLDQSDISDDEESFDEIKPYDLSTKEGLDEFKRFLLDTVAEKYLRFWIDVECLKYSHDKDGMTELVLQKYLKNGGLYELPRDIVKDLELQETSKLAFDELQAKHSRILEPIISYWCARFTMHQQRQTNLKTLEYSRFVSETTKSLNRRENGSTSVNLEPDTCGMSHVNYKKQLLRPQSSRTQTNGGISRPLTAKHKIRAKSAHPRLIPATLPLETNASTAQLQNVTAPVRGSYGYKPKTPSTFSTTPDQDYISSVRLFINPIPTPGGKLTKLLGRLHSTAISPKKPEPQKGVHQTKTTDDVMDALIEGLILEKQAGGFFENFLHKIGNKQWLDCLSFWKSLQEYNALFFAVSLNPFILSKKAMWMYSRYVVDSGDQAVGVSQDIQRQVFKQVDPPYEELFDAVEDYALRCLVEAWKQLQEKEQTIYKRVNTEQKLRHIEIKVMAKRRQSVIQTNEHDETEFETEREKISIDEANRPYIQNGGFSFETLIRNRVEVEFFREFLGKKHTKGIKDLMAWTDMETFRRIPRSMEEKRNQKAKDVKSAWLTKKYFFGPDSPASREGQDLIMNVNGGRVMKERPTTPVITESQKFVRARIEKRWLTLFKQTTEFLERQKPRVSAPEIVEDVMLKRRLQRSEAAWKILNSRWVSSSRDVVALRTCLLNAKTCAEFKTFVALKGDTFENDVDFWLEVQKFKDLCHAHAQESFIRRKVHAITDCFLNSAIAPELQIDIPIEMAEKLLEKLTGRISVHPYIFREAQMTVFRMLFNHWKEFIGYRSKVPEGQSLQEHLDEKLRAMRAEIKAKRDASERRRLARLSAERKKKEKEERERKRMEDLASLFSIDAGAVFYSEAPEDELNSWFYSKHVVEQERQEHIRRLKEQGLEIPRELLVDDKDELKGRRSQRGSSAKLTGLDSKSMRSKRKGLSVVDTEESDKEGSSKATSLQPKTPQNLQKPHKASSRRGSQSPSLAHSLTAARRTSVLSRISDVTSTQDTKRDNNNNNATPQDEKDQKRKSSLQKPKIIVDEIQVIPDPDKVDESAQNSQQKKLLQIRPQRSKRVVHKPSQTRKGTVSLDAISCISDYSVLGDIDFQQTKRMSSKRQTGTATPLTFKSLKDFTNSPEGAPLAIPLPLVRITSASNKDALSDDDGSQGDKHLKSARNIFSSSVSQPRLSSAKRKNLLAKKQESVTADVIVN